MKYRKYGMTAILTLALISTSAARSFADATPNQIFKCETDAEDAMVDLVTEEAQAAGRKDLDDVASKSMKVIYDASALKKELHETCVKLFKASDF